MAGLGLLQMERLAILRQAQDPSAPPCPEARTSGTFTAAGGDVLRVEGAGTFCRADGSARYTFTFGGGTGRFQGTSGGGALVVPPLATGALDRWDGELVLAGQAAGGGQAPRMPNTGAGGQAATAGLPLGGGAIVAAALAALGYGTWRKQRNAARRR